jgi:hypothetical protein
VEQAGSFLVELAPGPCPGWINQWENRYRQGYALLSIRLVMVVLNSQNFNLVWQVPAESKTEICETGAVRDVQDGKVNRLSRVVTQFTPSDRLKRLCHSGFQV